jgi:hypothetical protein
VELEQLGDVADGVFDGLLERGIFGEELACFIGHCLLAVVHGGSP